MNFPLVIVLTAWCTLAFANTHPVVKAVYADNKLIPVQGDTIKVSSSEQLTFVFSQLPNDQTFHYQLLEADEQPKTEELPIAIYSSLKPGTYQFEGYVDSDNGFQETPPLTVIVSSSFMSKWWFVPSLLLYLLLLFGGALYFVMLSNFRNKEKLSELRNDWTNKLHNDIGGDLSSVALRLETLKRKLEPLDPKVKDRVIKAHRLLESIQKKLRFVFDLVDPKKDSLQVMLFDVWDYAEENFKLINANFHFRNELPESVKNKLDIGRVNKLYLVLKEVINNSVKYSEATLAGMRIELRKKDIFIEVKDNGKGFDQSLPLKGNGLKNLEQYSQEGFLDIDIQSEIGKGTTVTILVPDI